MTYNRKDFYFHKAKKENYAARSAFKLEEMDQKLRIFKPGMKVLDLGAAPGSWSQYASARVGPQGRILGIDIQDVRVTLPNAAFLLADIYEIDWDAVLAEYEMAPPFEVVMSDMAPRTTGIRETDQARSFDLCEFALATAKKYLAKEGTFICKFFHSNDFEKLRAEIKKSFHKVEATRPDSTRKESKEIFLIGIGFKG